MKIFENYFYLIDKLSNTVKLEELLRRTGRLTYGKLSNSASSAFMAGSDAEEPGRTKMKVGWPSFTLAWTMYLPISPVAPTTRILLFPIDHGKASI